MISWISAVVRWKEANYEYISEFGAIPQQKRTSDGLGSTGRDRREENNVICGVPHLRIQLERAHRGHRYTHSRISPSIVLVTPNHAPVSVTGYIYIYIYDRGSDTVA